MKHRKERRKYAPEFKQDAVKLAEKSVSPTPPENSTSP